MWAVALTFPGERTEYFLIGILRTHQFDGHLKDPFSHEEA
jgi:hypothetical protein